MKRIDLNKTDMSSMFSELEADILNFLWKHKETRSRTLFRELKNRHKCTHSTIAVTLDRLYKKGLLKRVEEKCKGGKRYVYYPRFSKEELGFEIANKFLRFLRKTFGEACEAKLRTKLK